MTTSQAFAARPVQDSKKSIVLIDLTYSGKMGGPCTARVYIADHGRFDTNGAQSKIGPVDAIFKAIRNMIPHEARLHLYEVHAVTEGTDSSAEVTVVLRGNKGEYHGVGTNTDTMIASAIAYIDALNQYRARD